MHGQEYNDRSDIWSLGCVMYEIATTYPPFKAKNEIELSKMVKECKIKRTEEFSEDFFDLICEMIQKDHRKRPSASQILEHPFIKKALSKEPTASASSSKDSSTTDHRQIERRLRRKEEELKLKEIALKELEAKL